jgi:hypothetical protein
MRKSLVKFHFALSVQIFEFVARLRNKSLSRGGVTVLENADAIDFEFLGIKPAGPAGEASRRPSVAIDIAAGSGSTHSGQLLL